MAEITITPANVRAAILISLTARALPDETIKLDIFAGAAIAEVKRRDPQWESRSEDDLAALNRAADYITASKLVKSVPVITAIRNETGAGVQQAAYDPDKREAELLGMAESELSSVIGDGSATSSMPVMFGLASGRRGA